MGTKPRLLDLFCGAGGAGEGYRRAGFDVTGVDNRPMPRNPHRFIQDDALDYLDKHGHEYDVIHASPPCQQYTRAKHLRNAQSGTTSAPDLVDSVRLAICKTGKPYVIENVVGAPMQGITLCGSQFGLAVRRHRIFESNILILVRKCDHKKQGRPIGVYHRLNDQIPQGGKTARTLDEANKAMGIDWMTWEELKQSIPPSYTEFIGIQLLNHLSGGE